MHCYRKSSHFLVLVCRWNSLKENDLCCSFAFMILDELLIFAELILIQNSEYKRNVNSLLTCPAIKMEIRRADERSVQNIHIGSPLWFLSSHMCFLLMPRFPDNTINSKNMQLSLLQRKQAHFFPKGVRTGSLYPMNGCSCPVEMHTEVFVCSLGFALKYSGKNSGEERWSKIGKNVDYYWDWIMGT